CGDGHEKAAEQDDRGKEDHVAGDAGHREGGPPEQQPDHKHRPPRRRPTLSDFFCVHGDQLAQSGGAGDASSQRVSPTLTTRWASRPLRPAPCQCSSFGSVVTVSPTRIRWGSAPRAWTQPSPSITYRSWPPSWACQW